LVVPRPVVAVKGKSGDFGCAAVSDSGIVRVS
jgi:hypothetical protein